MRSKPSTAKRLVVKVGSSLFYGPGRKLDLGLIDRIGEQIYTLLKQSRQIVLVSSGAVGLGMSLLGLKQRPKLLADLQAVAAIGQNELMNVYRGYFSPKSINCGQVLLTWDDFTDRRRYLNAKKTLITLLKMGSMPVINENDTVATDEIKFGDNDQLSALVACLLDADILIMLSDVDGLLEKDKKTLIRRVDHITQEVCSLATQTDKQTSVGGMITKLKACRMAVSSGIPCVIANGRREGVIARLAEDPSSTGTFFAPAGNFLSEKKRWMAYGARPKGSIKVDDGAKNALLANRSLLSVGINGFSGNFVQGDIVSVLDSKEAEFARGKVAVSSSKLSEIKGSRYHKEIIHRDNIVILCA